MSKTHIIRIENILQSFSDIETSELKTKLFPSDILYINGSVIFKNGHQLAFTEVHDIGIIDKLKYRYQYMNKKQVMVFRYDNAFHHKDIDTYPHHKHTTTRIIACLEPTLYDILLEITQLMHDSG